MVGSVKTLGVSGLSGFEAGIECFVSGGLPGFDLVGLPDAAVKESRERVRAAAKNCGIELPRSRVTVNLTPADVRKEGSHFDLPILLGLVAASGKLEIPSDAAFLGELSLSGELRPVRGALTMALAAEKSGIKRLFLPAQNAREAALARGIAIYPAADVTQILKYFSGECDMFPQKTEFISEEFPSGFPDFSGVKGQDNIKRALEIAAAGGHNVLMIGPPGSGKSMLAKRLPSILPPLTYEESLESTQIYSAAGLLTRERPMITARPFRSPHHTVSSAGLSGGGSDPRPGEMSLAHNGVLFLDEFPEFQRASIEVMRQPMEDGELTVSRARAAAVFPARFTLIAAMNPCRCGWLGTGSDRCRCTQSSIASYRAKVSGPMLDRIDIHVAVRPVEYADLTSDAKGETSAEIRKRVMFARETQKARYGSNLACNARAGAEERDALFAVTPPASKLLDRAFKQLGLTARSYDRIVKVSRTIADLGGDEKIEPKHIAEALQYRSINN